MLPRADTSVTPVARLDPVGRVVPVADARQDAFTRALAGEIGKTLQGEVLSRLTDGSFVVKIAGAAARMMLPGGAQVGQQVPLTLVALSPRPTFEVATRQGTQVTVALSDAAPEPGALEGEAAPPGAQQATQLAVQLAVQKPLSYAAALLARAPLTSSDRLHSIDPKSTPATLSDTGRTLSTVLGRAAAGAPTALVVPTPLTTPGAAPPQIAAALAQSLSESGLFYESHVAEWSNGERPLESLAREPQMARQARAEEAPGRPLQRQEHAAGAALERAGASAESAQPARAATLPLDTEAARFVNFQLNTQEQGRVAWEGQPWPGQPMRWEVSRDAPERQPGGGVEGDPAWRSGVRLRFPLLGEIDARVVLHQGQLHIQVEAGSGATGELLRADTERLRHALEAAGLALTSLNIRNAEDAP